ncbi:Unknown protein, partial [Striga hermonthica]
VKFNLGGSKKLQVPQVDIRRNEEEPSDNNGSCHDGKPTLSIQDSMPESQYIGRLQRESSPPAFRLKIRQQPGEDDQHIQSFVLRSCLINGTLSFRK